MACPVCHTEVAPFDPERVVRGAVVLHGRCARVHTPVRAVLNCKVRKQPKLQIHFRFPEMIRVRG